MDSIEERRAIIWAIERKTNAEMQKTDLAEKLGITRMSLFNRLKTGKFSDQEKKILISNGIIWETNSIKSKQ